MDQRQNVTAPRRKQMLEPIVIAFMAGRRQLRGNITEFVLPLVLFLPSQGKSAFVFTTTDKLLRDSSLTNSLCTLHLQLVGLTSSDSNRRF